MPHTQTPPSARLNALGEFADKAEERAFRLAHYPATRRRMRFVCATSGMAYLAALFADSFLLSGPDLAGMAAARVLAALFALAVLVYAFRADGSPARLGVLTSLYMTALVASEVFELALKADKAPLPETPITVFLVLLFYLYMPPMLMQALIIGTAGAAAYLLTMALGTPATPGQVANTALLFALATGFGAYFCIRFGAAQRREFQARSELRYRAEKDPLTGICNRGRLMELASRECAAARRYGYPCALLMLDIDHFKSVNDTHGHAAGDAVLCEMAGRCENGLREADLFGRVGGEEFVILMPHCNGSQALAAADRVLDTIRSEPFAHNGSALCVTASIGVAELDPDDARLDRLMQDADAGLYRAKQEGRDRACLPCEAKADRAKRGTVDA